MLCIAKRGAPEAVPRPGRRAATIRPSLSLTLPLSLWEHPLSLSRSLSLSLSLGTSSLSLSLSLSLAQWEHPLRQSSLRVPSPSRGHDPTLRVRGRAGSGGRRQRGGRSPPGCRAATIRVSLSSLSLSLSHTHTHSLSLSYRAVGRQRRHVLVDLHEPAQPRRPDPARPAGQALRVPGHPPRTRRLRTRRLRTRRLLGSRCPAGPPNYLRRSCYLGCT